MNYNKGHKSSSQSGKCIVCNKKTGNYLTIERYSSRETRVGCGIDVPVCDGECNKKVSKHKQMFIEHCLMINALILKG
jgi:hypothetical protein